MTEYVLPHTLEGERQRLALMSDLLDPLERAHLETLGLRSGWRCLEVGCGNGSISQWLAERVGPGGVAVASDMDLQYVAGMKAANLEIRRLNILEDDVEEGSCDLVTARAVLHHVASPEKAIQRMCAALKHGGVLLSIEPDMLPATATEPESMHGFWQGWLKWSASADVNYFIGRKMPAMLASAGLEAIGAEGDTAIYNGGSAWAVYWMQTIRELRGRLIESGCLTPDALDDFARRYSDANYWTSAITFVASWGRKPK
jgi:SAM-dependent methyltransferase